MVKAKLQEPEDADINAKVCQRGVGQRVQISLETSCLRYSWVKCLVTTMMRDLGTVKESFLGW